VTGRPAPRPAKRPGPSWVQQATWRPSKALLSKLRAEVAANPRDRKPRNSLAWALVKDGQFEAVRDFALEWQPYDPRNPMVYEYLGLAFDALGEEDQALRAFSTIAEISPGDSGLLNRAGFLAFRAEQFEMAETLFGFAIERRPEHQNNYRGMALALWAQGKYGKAIESLETALKQNYNGRYKDVKRILREEAGLILNAWLRSDKGASSEVKRWAGKLGVDLNRQDAMRITLHWETDANDVDLHVVDPYGEESFYSHRQTASGLNLYEDLTQGLGPECTVLPAGRKVDGSYHVGVKYFAAGPMGVSRGIVVIQRSSEDGRPDVSIFPFTLLPDIEGNAQDMRHVALEE
jgi:tetratricopeptide (TPR) repeat protein